jgi:hypothetical protein
MYIGNITSLFEGGVDYCVHIAEKYGGAVRLYGPPGVSCPFMTSAVITFHALRHLGNCICV